LAGTAACAAAMLLLAYVIFIQLHELDRPVLSRLETEDCAIVICTFFISPLLAAALWPALRGLPLRRARLDTSHRLD